MNSILSNIAFEAFKMKPTRKKLLKLKKDPKAFFRDLRVVKLVMRKFFKEQAVESIIPAKKETTPIQQVKPKSTPSQPAGNKPAVKKVEPKVIGMLMSENGQAKINFFGKKVKADKKLTSLILLDHDEKSSALVHNSQAKTFLKDKNFIGFKDGYSFFLTRDSNKPISQSEVSLFENSFFRQNPVEMFQNIFVYNPFDLFSFSLRMTAPGARLIVIIDEKFNDFKLLNKYKERIDVCLYHESHKDALSNGFRRSIMFLDDLSLEKIVKQIIIDNSVKHDNLLFPIFGVDAPIDGIEKYNNSNTGVLIGVKNIKKSGFDTFDEYLKDLHQNATKLLVKEDVYNRYKTLLDEENYLEFYKKSVIDGVKYEFI